MAASHPKLPSQFDSKRTHELSKVISGPEAAYGSLIRDERLQAFEIFFN
jgi:hypothetical protein